MGNRLGCLFAAVAALTVFGLAVTWLAKARTAQERVYCVNNLRVLVQFADQHARLNPERPLFADEKARPAADKKAPAPDGVPPGTVVNPALPPDRRLSWVVHLLPVLGTKQDTKSMSDALDRSAAWDAPPHVGLSRAPLEGLRCYGKTPTVPFDSPAVTQFVGTGGIGADAPVWAGDAPPPTAGAFRWDGPTPFAAFRDGLAGSLLFAETDRELGPWLRGGPATVRTFDPTQPAVGGQFGGTHPGGGNFAFADGSVRFLSDRTAGEVFYGLMTVAGGASDPVPGD